MCLVTQSCPNLCDPMDCSPPGYSVHGDFPGRNTGVDSLALLQGIFPTQVSKPGLPYCRHILYCLSHQGRIWVSNIYSSRRNGLKALDLRKGPVTSLGSEGHLLQTFTSCSDHSCRTLLQLWQGCISSALPDCCFNSS